jgi:acetyl-CoA carboxylase carboxyltransferase component
MHISGGVSAAYKQEILNSPNPEQKKIEIEQRLNQISSPFRTAEATGQNIIDPRKTRGKICRFVTDSQRVLENQLGQSRMSYLP